MSYFAQLAATLACLDRQSLDCLFARVRDGQARGGTLWLAGNGGSAAVAQHWACDLSKAAGVRCQALGSNAAALTAWANDTSYDLALAYEFERLVRPGDALICLSCSGTSKNIYRALLNAAHLNDRRGPISLAIVTGSAWENPYTVPVTAVAVPHDDYGIIEDCFAAIGHWITNELRADK